jgi:myosin heavy subunit
MAFKQMIENRMKQAIVISGESGSGKTESAKCAMKFLTSLSQKSYNSGEPGIEQKILDTNPILESFGNAKTVRNNNSSRFGKYVLLYFGMNGGDIKGARVKNYLLEKSRVVGPASNERNYHVFYHLIRGAKEEHLQKLGLVNKISGKRLLYPEIAFLKNGADVD